MNHLAKLSLVLFAVILIGGAAACGEGEKVTLGSDNQANPCSLATDTAGVGSCDKLVGVAYKKVDGVTQCWAIGGCECEGADCDKIFATEKGCAEATANCPK